MPPFDDSLRRQLEGRLEIIEQALAQHDSLVRCLASLNWRGRLRRRPELLRAIREQAPLLDEALASVARRARREEGNEDQPLRGVLQALQAQQARLEALARKRLAGLSGLERLSFGEVLEHLEAVLRSDEPRLPDATETVLLDARDDRHLKWFLPLCCLGATALAWCAHTVMREHVLEFLSVFLAAFLVPVFGQFLLAFMFTGFTGRFWLTPERLIWQPLFGQRVQVGLASIAPEGVTLHPDGNGVQVRGERSVTLRSAFLSRPLAALLAHYRQPPLRELRNVAPPVQEVVSYPARFRVYPGTDEERGLVVLWSGFVVFLPEPRHSSLFTRLLGPGCNQLLRDVSMERLVERLRVLSDEDFKRCLEQAVRVREGHFWSVTEVEPGTLVSVSGKEHCLFSRECVGEKDGPFRRKWVLVPVQLTPASAERIERRLRGIPNP